MKSCDEAKVCLEYLKNSQGLMFFKGQTRGELLEGFKQRSDQIRVERIIVVTWLKIDYSGASKSRGSR